MGQLRVNDLARFNLGRITDVVSLSVPGEAVPAGKHSLRAHSFQVALPFVKTADPQVHEPGHLPHPLHGMLDAFLGGRQSGRGPRERCRGTVTTSWTRGRLSSRAT